MTLAKKLKDAQILLVTKTQECQRLYKENRSMAADEKRLTGLSCRFQLEIAQLESQRDVLIAALADAQRRLGVLRNKTRPCGCGKAISEDADETGMTLTDKAAEVLG